MHRELFLSVVQNILKRFRPFTLELSNGSKLEVNHPEALTMSERTLVYTGSRGVRSVLEYDVIFRIVDMTT